MSMRMILIAMLFIALPVVAFAEAEEGEAEATHDTVVESDTDPESVQIRQPLAVHLGLTPNDVVFGKPRNFRSESLNDFQLDPLTEADAE